jgi:hypothetical protein
MAKKAFKPPRIAPLQRVVAVPITDPAEQAAIDRMRKRLRRKAKGPQSTTGRSGAKPSSRSARKKSA